MDLSTKIGIKKANLIGCLQCGMIDWFQFFEAWKALEDEEKKEKVVFWITDGNTGKKVA